MSFITYFGTGEEWRYEVRRRTHEVTRNPRSTNQRVNLCFCTNQICVSLTGDFLRRVLRNECTVDIADEPMDSSEFTLHQSTCKPMFHTNQISIILLGGGSRKSSPLKAMYEKKLQYFLPSEHCYIRRLA
jgi:hypothetical protein